MYKSKYEVIIIGGSYSGLSAAMALGRSMRRVLVIDSGAPCNRQTPHSHNFLSRDGERPDVISAIALAQLKAYESVEWESGLAVEGKKVSDGFEITLEDGRRFQSGKLILATGLHDIMPSIPGFAECWGISVIHCPYCHGYEVRHQKTGILANGEMAIHYAQLISNWTKDLTILSNGPAKLNPEEMAKLQRKNIGLIETEIEQLQHNHGHLQQVVFRDGTQLNLSAVYARPAFEQKSTIPAQLGCTLTEQGLLQVDKFQKTSVNDVFACGDNTTLMRSVAAAVAAGNMAGAALNNELTVAEFQ